MGRPGFEPVARTRFEQLVMPHRNAAFNLAYWMLRNRDEAEDVVQDAYLRAYRGFTSFKGDDAKPWLLMIVRNVAFTALEGRKRSNNVVVLADDLRARKDDVLSEIACSGPSPEALVIAKGERQRLQAALAALPLKYRDIIVLREMEGLAYNEIAEVTGTAIGTVMSRLSRARAELRKNLLLCTAGNEANAV
jgi:RNA polymerase sigma-70 factor (ECF subfamily)